MSTVRPETVISRDKIIIQRDGRDVVVCERGEVSLTRDGKGIAQEWSYDPIEPTVQQVDDKFGMIDVILSRLLDGVGTTMMRLEIAARLSRLAAKVRGGSKTVGVEQ